MTALAFHNTPVTKPQLIAQLEAHAAADHFIKGRYWQGGKGCSVGCALESIRVIEGLPKIEHGDHAYAAKTTNIPEMLWRLNDCIFEGLPNGEAKAWPLRFAHAVKPGSDLSRTGWQFLHWLLTDNTVNPGIDHPLVRDAVKQCSDVLAPLTRGETVDIAAATEAESAASAAWSAEGAAASAAWSAAWSARSAAGSAESAAGSAACAVWSVRSMESVAYVKMADKLITLIEAA